MKAIQINGEIKTFNSIPDKWNQTLGYNYEDPTVWDADGFKDVVEPTYNTATHRKGVIIFDEANDFFTYEVIALTVNEITIIEEEQDRSDQEILEAKGQRLYEKTKNRLIRRNKKGLITKARAKKVREYLHPIFLLLKTGDIDLANDKAILLPTDANADINGELVWFKAQLAALLTDVNTLL